MPEPQFDPEKQENKTKNNFWDLFSFRRPGGQWQGRVFLRPDPENSESYIAYKFARRSESSVQKLKVEETRIKQAKQFGMTEAPVILNEVGPLKDLIGAFPPELDPENVLKYSTSKASRQYMTWKYTDMHPVMRAHWVREFALKGMNDLLTWFKNGYIHTSLSPLTHSNVFDETWFWNIDPIGEVQDLKASLRHTNLRRSGLEDFEHIKKIDSDINLEFVVGQSLVEWMITAAYAGFMNDVPALSAKPFGISVKSILSDGYNTFLDSLSADHDPLLSLELISNFTERFEQEWKTNRLLSPTSDSPDTALASLVKLTQMFLRDLDKSESYNSMKTAWLAGSSLYRSDEIIPAGHGRLIRKSWSERTITLLDEAARPFAQADIKSAPKSVALNGPDILIMVEAGLLVFNDKLKLQAELPGDFKPVIQSDQNLNITLLQKSGEIIVLNKNLERISLISKHSGFSEHCPLITVSREGRLLVADRMKYSISGYSFGEYQPEWEFILPERPDAIAAVSDSLIFTGYDGKLASYNKTGEQINESQLPEHITSLTLDHHGHVMAGDKFKNRILIYDYQLNHLSEIISYGNEHKVLLYSEDMKLIGEIRGVQNPYKITEDSKYMLQIIKRRKNMGIIQYIA